MTYLPLAEELQRANGYGRRKSPVFFFKVLAIKTVLSGIFKNRDTILKRAERVEMDLGGVRERSRGGANPLQTCIEISIIVRKILPIYACMKIN